MTSTRSRPRWVSRSRDTVRLIYYFALTVTDTETGPGVFETALAYTDAGRMADNALLFKLVAKSMGMKHNVLPSFMAKPWENVGTYVLV